MVAKERSAAAKKGLACSTTTMVFLSVNHRAPLPTSWAPGMLFLFTPGPRTMILPPAEREEAERNRVERGGTRENKSIGRRLSVALSLPVIERFRSRGKKKKKNRKERNQWAPRSPCSSHRLLFSRSQGHETLLRPHSAKVQIQTRRRRGETKPKRDASILKNLKIKNLQKTRETHPDVGQVLDEPQRRVRADEAGGARDEDHLGLVAVVAVGGGDDAGEAGHGVCFFV